MGDVIVRLSDAELGRLIDGLRRGAIPLNASPLHLERAGLPGRAAQLATWLPEATGRFGTAAGLIASLEMVQADRRLSGRTARPADLVVPGPTADCDSLRDTRVVVREVLESARRSVLIVGYAFFGSPAIFEPLARRMGADAKFRTRLIINVHPTAANSPAHCLIQSAHLVATAIWPFHPRPEVYYLPDSFDPDPSRRASVHAKLIVADEETVYIGSANFTTAALRRNIEVGLRIQDAVLAQSTIAHFDLLISSNALRPLDEDASEV